MKKNRNVDLTGLKCPMPIVQLSKIMKELNEGEEFTATADDPAFCLDVESWCNKTGHKLVHLDNSAQQLVAVIQKNSVRSLSP